jgi:hypothetical protein
MNKGPDYHGAQGSERPECRNDDSIDRKSPDVKKNHWREREMVTATVTSLGREGWSVGANNRKG